MFWWRLSWSSRLRGRLGVPTVLMPRLVDSLQLSKRAASRKKKPEQHSTHRNQSRLHSKPCMKLAGKRAAAATSCSRLHEISTSIIATSAAAAAAAASFQMLSTTSEAACCALRVLVMLKRPRYIARVGRARLHIHSVPSLNTYSNTCAYLNKHAQCLLIPSDLFVGILSLFM